MLEPGVIVDVVTGFGGSVIDDIEVVAMVDVGACPGLIALTDNRFVLAVILMNMLKTTMQIISVLLDISFYYYFTSDGL